MLLDLLDQHEDTLCRNEPNAGGVIGALPKTPFEDDLDDSFMESWRQAIASARLRQSGRDRFAVAHKSYLRAAPLSRPGLKIIGSRTARSALGRVFPAYRQFEWPMPGWIYDHSKLPAAFPIFKMGVPGWVLKVHAAEPGQQILHIVREPAGFLQSWWNRYVLTRAGGPEAVFAESLRDLDGILTRLGKEPGQFTDYSKEALIEAQLWRWRYANETVLASLGSSPRYHLVRYREARQEPVATARRLYAALGLSFTDTHARRIAGLKQTLFTTPHSEKLDAGLVDEMVGKVMKDSPCREMLLADAKRTEDG